MMVKRPSVGAEGFVLNHYDRAAVQGYLKNVGDRLMQGGSGQHDIQLPFRFRQDGMSICPEAVQQPG